MYTKAIQYNIKSVTIIENVSGTNNLHYINSLWSLSKQYVFIENFNMGELTLFESSEHCKNVYGEAPSGIRKTLWRNWQIFTNG
ncbi:MAG: hypothetical protein IPJ29_10485 [Chitinophagaceae bacterium]|nr:hypothetical protein [Chitinophagaceae bacterium]